MVQVLSASRRVEIGFYPHLVKAALERVKGPFFWVWWCKIPSLLEAWDIDWRRSAMQLTITGLAGTPGPAGELEPNVPPAEEVWKSVERLIGRGLNPELVDWRYDPLLAGWNTSLEQIEQQARLAKKLGIKRCITSFAAPYPKVARRWPAVKQALMEEEEQRSLVLQMRELLKSFDIKLLCCTQPHLEEILTPAACIDGSRCSETTGLEFDTRLALGQRPHCLCTRSLDIGWYLACPAGCVYCYACPESLS
jgi:DNA repair photolyase